MILSSKLTWGLAWTGLAVILAVPSADFLTGQFAGKGSAAVVTSTTAPVTPAAKPAPAEKTANALPSVTTKVTKNGITIMPANGTTGAPPTTTASKDPVQTYLNKNKALPDYLSDGASGGPANGQVANIDPQTISGPPPVPFPARPVELMRTPRPAAVPTDPVKTGAAPTQPVVIVDDTPPPQEANAGPVPPAAIVDDSASWRAQGLSGYLERNGLLTEDSPADSTATITETAPPDSYDPDGFYLSDGPNNAAAQRRARVLQMLGDDPNAPVPPESFKLF